MKSFLSVAVICFGAAVCMATTTVAATTPLGASQNQRQTQPAPSAGESAAYRTLSQVENPSSKLPLLDAFVARYPRSSSLPSVFREYAIAYFMMEKFPESVAYADKFLAQTGDVVGETVAEAMFGDDQRLNGLYIRTQAYFAGCYENAFHTRDAETKARDAAEQGLRALSQWPKPSDMRDEQFQSTQREVGNRLRAVVAITASELQGNAPADSCKASFAPDPGKFNRTMDAIQSQETQSLPVR